MSFRLINAPSTFQALINKVLQNYLRKFILVFFYDILIYYKNWNTYLEYLSVGFDILQAHKLKVKINLESRRHTAWDI